MKAKRLVSLAIPLILLGGCGTDSAENETKKVETKAAQKENKPSTEKKEDKLTVAKGEPLTVQEYPTKILNQASELIKVGLDIQTMATSEKTETEKIKEFEGLVVKLKDTTKKIKEVNPPSEFKEDHETIVKAMNLYDEAYTLQIESAKEGDNEKMKTSLNMIKEGGKYWKEATANIAKKKQELAGK